MSPRKPSVLLLGATGYIGGSVLDGVLRHPKASELDITIYVRSAETGNNFDDLGLGLKVVSGGLHELEAATAVSQIVINCAADDLLLSEAILRGAKKFHKTTGQPLSLIHTSGSGCVVDYALGQFATDKVFDDLDNDTLNALPATQWHRHVDIPITNAAKEGYVKSYLVAPGMIYGLATGTFVDAGIVNPIPTVLSGVAAGAVMGGQGAIVGPQKNIWSCVEIHDVVDAYLILLSSVLDGRDIPSGTEGYYFLENGAVVTFDVCKKAAEALHVLGKLKTAELRQYTEEEISAPGSPLPYFGANSWVRSSKIRKLGWKPTHVPQDYLDGIKGELEVMINKGLSKGFPPH